MKTHEKPAVISAETVMQVRRATGMGVLQTKQFLEQASPLYYSRLSEAILSEKTRGRCLYDPIEDEPTFKTAFKEAESEAENELRSQEQQHYQRTPPHLHFLWRRGQGGYFRGIKQRILREKYHIEWFTLEQMNPGCCID